MCRSWGQHSGKSVTFSSFLCLYHIYVCMTNALSLQKNSSGPCEQFGLLATLQPCRSCCYSPGCYTLAAYPYPFLLPHLAHPVTGPPLYKRCYRGIGHWNMALCPIFCFGSAAVTCHRTRTVTALDVHTTSLMHSSLLQKQVGHNDRHAAVRGTELCAGQYAQTCFWPGWNLGCEEA